MSIRFNSMKRALTLVAVVALAVAAFAQTQIEKKPFEPTVGQSGKDVVWVPSAEDVVGKMLDLAKITPADFLVDLGSGDGRTVIAAAKRGARALGIEYNPDMVELSKANAAKAGVADKARFVNADLFESDFSEATIVTLFLLPEINLKLRPKILDMKPGTRIVTNTFTMGEWSCDEQVNADGNDSTDSEDYGSYRTALLYIVPAKVAGTWRTGQDELVLTQSFQTVTGSLKSGSRSQAISNGKLRGDQLHFEAGGSEYSGKVSGDKIEGNVKSAGRTALWTAMRAAH